jgi:tryptophan halogenase
MANRFYEILDFINMHYCLTQRSDTEFWQEIRQSERVHERLKAKLDYWRIKPPSQADFEDQWFPGQASTALFSDSRPGDNRGPVDTGGVFGLSSYEAILYGMDFLRDECGQWFGKDRPPSRISPQIVERMEAAALQLPEHDKWLQQFVGMADYGS